LVVALVKLTQPTSESGVTVAGTGSGNSPVAAAAAAQNTHGSFFEFPVSPVDGEESSAPWQMISDASGVRGRLTATVVSKAARKAWRATA
jgi:hypothetical protein